MRTRVTSDKHIIRWELWKQVAKETAQLVLLNGARVVLDTSNHVTSQSVSLIPHHIVLLELVPCATHCIVVMLGGRGRDVGVAGLGGSRERLDETALL